MAKPLVKNKKIQDPHLLAGFTSAEGCFLIRLGKNSKYKTGVQVQLEFKLTQHSLSKIWRIIENL